MAICWSIVFRFTDTVISLVGFSLVILPFHYNHIDFSDTVFTEKWKLKKAIIWVRFQMTKSQRIQNPSGYIRKKGRE